MIIEIVYVFVICAYMTTSPGERYTLIIFFFIFNKRLTFARWLKNRFKLFKPVF